MRKLLTVLIPTFNNYSLFLKVEAYKTDKRVIIIVSDDSSDPFQKLK